MDMIAKLCAGVSLPKVVAVKQSFYAQKIAPEDIRQTVWAQMEREEACAGICPGMRIAITCGSRGVANIALVTKAIVDFVAQRGAAPFIIPAMGSHGGATAEGQAQILAGYGVTAESMGCPVRSSMETVEIGRTPKGHPVRIDRLAAEADGIIVSGRIKPHTDFRGPYESGLMKMMAIGLGKQEGAEICHRTGFGNMAELVPLFGACILQNAPVLMGIGILENGYEETSKIVALTPAEIIDKEPALLEEARGMMPGILLRGADVLVVHEIGKNISGDGMDPNITGAFCTPGMTGGLGANKNVVLNLTPETHGSAMGIGAAQVTTRRLLDSIDYNATYANAITCTVLDYARIPVIAECDRDAIALAVKTCECADPGNVRVVLIKNSLDIETIYISESLVGEAAQHGNLSIQGDPLPLPFDGDGNLLLFQ